MKQRGFGIVIYAIKAEGTEFVKFGRANNPVRRLSQLQTSSPYDLKIIDCADWADVEEPKIHIFLQASHIRGEWFKRTSDVERLIGLLRDGERGHREWHRMTLGGFTTKQAQMAHVRRISGAAWA